jgi:hypothetical protein
MWMTLPSHAQNRGVYPLGMSAINSGVLPESTFTYSNQFLLYTRDEAKDNEGQTLPVTGIHSVILDMHTITWVSELRILGARYAASATLPFSKNDLTSDLQGNLSAGSGFADSYYLPIILAGPGRGPPCARCTASWRQPGGSARARMTMSVRAIGRMRYLAGRHFT